MNSDIRQKFKETPFVVNSRYFQDIAEGYSKLQIERDQALAKAEVSKQATIALRKAAHESSKLSDVRQFQEKLLRQKDKEILELREACERNQGWYTVRGARDHFPSLNAFTIQLVSSLLNRTRKRMKLAIRRMPSSDANPGQLTYHIKVVEALIEEVNTRTLK
ncbi:MAG TPA: hypothetical protein VE954_05775 [Oligoflexus sp.]|uniref:hypothetical protein n=1 Tax=Oligoflexus sp. TaxID=1971216 RepID=UPI002D5AE923|nr:hypothetical protein [Oligoflexus sp.]HYX32601.1 hypothetical protein [Oligoflexus sp.]